MYTLHLPTIGEVGLRFATIRFDGCKIYISGDDEEHNRIDLTLDRIVYPEERPEDYGYCHIISYTTRGQSVPCDMYRAIH